MYLSNPVSVNPFARAKPPPISNRIPHGMVTAVFQSNNLELIVLSTCVLSISGLFLSFSTSFCFGLSVLSDRVFLENDGMIKNNIAAISAIAASFTKGKRSFHIKPLVIQATAVPTNIHVTIFSSVFIFPSSVKFLKTVFFPSTIGELLIFPIFMIYTHNKPNIIKLVGTPINIHFPKLTSMFSSDPDKEANIALGGVPINVAIPPMLAE